MPRKQLEKRYKNTRTLPCWCGFFGTKEEVEVDADGKVIDANAIKVFTQGQCHAFALAVNKLTGWQPAAVSMNDTPYGEEDVYSDDPDAEPAHIVVLTPEGKLLDINGLKAKQKMEKHYLPGTYRIQPTDPERLLTFQTYMRPNVNAAIPFARTVLEKEGYNVKQSR